MFTKLWTGEQALGWASRNSQNKTVERACQGCFCLCKSQEGKGSIQTGLCLPTVQVATCIQHLLTRTESAYKERNT